MTYIKQIYTAFIQVSGLKLWSLGDCNCAILHRGYALSKIVQLSLRAHSFNQSPHYSIYLSIIYLFFALSPSMKQNI